MRIDRLIADITALTAAALGSVELALPATLSIYPAGPPAIVPAYIR
jgi:hypothetical protein